MNTIFNLIEGFEKLAYRILLWFILIPKTLAQVVIHPGWASGYVREELKQEKNPFDEYMSPVVILLTVALIPAVLLNFLPNYQVIITKPGAEETGANEGTIESWIRQNNPVAQRSGDAFEATADFASTSSQMLYEFEWYVEEVQYDQNGYMTGYQEIENSRVSHSQINGTADSIKSVDNNTSIDRFSYRFLKPGGYYVNVQVWKIDPTNNLPVETHIDYLYVYVPETNNPELRGLISESRSKRPTSASRQEWLAAVTNELKTETTVFLAFGMLLPPLLFAFATKMVTGREISENSLREIFYEQCYYFAPISLALWASMYAYRFFTYDIFSFYEVAVLMVWLPVVLAAVWFVAVEVRAIVREGEIQKGEEIIRTISPRKAFFIVAGCIGLTVTALVVFTLLRDAQGQDFVRRNLIRVYILGSVGLLIWYLWGWNRARRNEQRKLSRANILLFGTFAFVFLCVFGCILAVGPTSPRVAAPPPTATNEPTPSASVTPSPVPSPTDVQPTPGEVVVESSQFYTEEFEGDLAAWAPFMVSGIESQVGISIGDGKLTIQLSPFEDKIPVYYLINRSFTYTDVQVEAVVTNRGNNANGTSLVCRFSDRGWYEFWLSNSGNYEIYAFDGTDNSYYTLFTGGSSAIRSGSSTNVYTGICKGDELTLLVNGETIRSVTDIRFRFPEGNIGIGVSSPQTLPVELQFESLTVSNP